MIVLWLFDHFIRGLMAIDHWLHPKPHRTTRQRYFEAWPTPLADRKEESA